MMKMMCIFTEVRWFGGSVVRADTRLTRHDPTGARSLCAPICLSGGLDYG